MVVLTENARPGEAIMSEGMRSISRENVVIAAEQSISANGLLAKKASVADVVATPSAASGNTGNATIAMGSPAVTSKVKDGRYKGIAVTATTVRWEDPSGKEIGTSTHGAEFSKGGVKFTITAGGNANVAGDEFYIDVAADAEDFEWVAFDQDGTDGSEIPAAYSIYAVETGVGEKKETAAIVRLAELNGNCIAWPEDIDAGERANAIQALAEHNIIVRY